MDLAKLTAFFAVAQTKSFSKAADLLFKNQSAISRQILALEKELGVQLFIRGSRSVVLTKAGQVFKAGMEKVTDLYQAVLSNTHAAQSGYIGEVRICTHPGTLYSNILTPVVLAFEKQHPEIFVSLQTSYSGDASRKLDEHSVDFVFWRWEEYSSISRSYMNVVERPNGFLLPADHPKASIAPEDLTLDDFKDDTFILLSDYIAPKLASRLIKKYAALGYDPKVLYAPDLDTSLLWVSARRGIIAASDQCIAAGNPAFRFVPLQQLGRTIFSFIWDKQNDNPSMEVFLAFLSDYVAEHSPSV